ncbi:MAG: VWA domain-containing protein, partial [Chloroflexota bacterium]
MLEFLWPRMLWALLLAPALVWGYLRLANRQAQRAARLPALRRSPDWQRRLPPVVFLLGLLVLLVGLSRPQARIQLPRVEGTLMLVVDVSASMGARDVQPSRLEAAKQAARQIVLNQPETVRVGLVAFSGSGFAVQPPTDDSQRLLAAVDRLAPTSGTSLGQGILVALHALAVDAGLAGVSQGPPDLGQVDPASPSEPGGHTPG